MKSLANTAGQLQLLPPESEADYYHQSDKFGFFSLLFGSSMDRHRNTKQQKSWPVPKMAQVLSMLDPNRDTWLSQAEFCRPNRRVVNLARVGLLFVDLDTYRVASLADKTPEDLVYIVRMFCQDNAIPEPSFIVHSGRGLQLKWLLDGFLPRQALPRWNNCQQALVEKLTDLGADKGAKDASRVLRVVNTVNTKNGEICRVVYINGSIEEPYRYNFEYLCEALLPVARWDLEEQRRQKQQKKLSLAHSGNLSGLRRFSGRQLAWDRLEDLRTLATMRGGYQEGERMRHLFWQLNFLLLSGAVMDTTLFHEAAELAKQIDPAWNYRSAELTTLYHKARDYRSGKTVEFNGKTYPALYTPKNDMLINLFGISDDEQKRLKTIISTDEAKVRDAFRKQQARREAGSVSRDEYLDQANEKAKQAGRLRRQGLSIRAIAEEMAVSKSQIHRYLALAAFMD